MCIRDRASCDAVIVGGGTVRADDPLLTSRGRRDPEPLRVVMSQGLDLPDHARLWDPSAAPTLVAHGPEAGPEGRERLDGLGVERLELTVCEPTTLLETLAGRGCNQVLWECGPTLATEVVRQRAVQQLAVVIAPKLLGGCEARTPLHDLGLVEVKGAQAWQVGDLMMSGDDLIWSLDECEEDGSG